jgi:hypothetical protein
VLLGPVEVAVGSRQPSLLWARGATSAKERNAPRDERDASIDGPPRLTRHEAAGQNADALEEPYRPDQQEQDTHDVKDDPHVASPFPAAPRVADAGVAPATR